MSFLDRVASAVSPSWALGRLRSRTQLEGLERARSALAGRHYEGADKGRRTQGWLAADTSATAAARGSLHELRARCRDLRRNNEWARAAVRELASNLAGRGVRPKFEHEEDEKLRLVEELWLEWAGTSTCDAAGRDTFYGLQLAATESMIDGGECLVRRRFRSLEDELPVPLQLQLLEGDHLDTLRDGEQTDGGGRIVQGVEFDALGRRRGYWLYRDHPGDTYYTGRERESIFVPAVGTSHFFQAERIGQVRGIAWGAPVVMRLHNFASYEDAEAVRLTVAASFSGFVHDLAPDSTFRPSLAAGGAGSVSGTNTKGQRIDELESGTVEYLDPGKTITFPNVPQNDGFPAYATVQLRAVAKGYGVPYWLVTGDLAGLPFSSIRADWVGFSRQLDTTRDRVLVTHLCEPALRWWLEAAEIAGTLPGMLPERAPRGPRRGERAARLRWSWINPRREMLDPRTEVMAEIAAVRAGFKSLSDVVQGLGSDPATVLATLAKDLASAREQDLVLDVDGSAAQDPGKIPGVNAGAGGGKPPRGKAKGKGESASDEAEDEDDEREERMARELVEHLQRRGVSLPAALELLAGDGAPVANGAHG